MDTNQGVHGHAGAATGVQGSCTLVRGWCLVAAQASGLDKDSYLMFGLNAVTEHNHDTSLASWLNTRLDSIPGRRPEQGGAGGATGMMPIYPQGQTLDAAVITRAIEQGLALGYQHLLPHRGAPSTTTGGGQASKAGESAYSTDDVCAMMAYSGINDPVDCQVIWTIFSKKKKNVKVCRRYLMKGMTEYAYECPISINAGIYLEQETMKSILDLPFNPGEGIIYVQSAAKGLSILCCRSCPNNETEEIKE